MKKSPKDTKVVVGMSGEAGSRSALKEQGYDVIGIFMKTWMIPMNLG